MRESIDDGVTVEITYEGRTHNAEVTDKPAADTSFADVFSDYTLPERLQILGFGSRDAYLDAKPTIEAKARDMVEHYVRHVFPNGFKAQVVSNSREAAARYKDKLDAALAAKIAEIEQENPLQVDLDRLKKLKTAVVISGGGTNDKAHLKAYSNPADHERIIKSFKLPFDGEDEGVTGEIGFIIVNNMLLTGFDAPIEQVMYLDQVIRAHNLLQAIARVNRVADDKTAGFIVDYVGVGHHLRQALSDYFEKEQQEILETLQDSESKINDLIAAHKAVKEFLAGRGITDLSDADAFYDLFYDEDPRYEYMLLFRKFSQCLDAVFPRQEALDFLKDFKEFSAINELARKHLRDQRLSMKGIPEKLRKLADQYLVSQGIDQQVEAISIIDEDFFKEIGKRTREKTKAAEIEHAIRHFIDINLNIDPELYASFAEALEQILAEFKNNWNEIRKRLEELRRKIINAEKEETYGLSRKKQMPFFRVFKKQFFDDQKLSDDQISILVSLTQEVFHRLETELQLKGFWDSIPARNRLKASLQELLLSREFYDKLPDVMRKRGEIISRIMEIAESNNDTILYAP